MIASKPGVKYWINPEEIEESAIEQINGMVLHPQRCGDIAILPDVHLGQGAVIGSVLPSKVLIPSAIGVDIGCGVLAAKLDLLSGELTDKFPDIYKAIRGSIPVGFSRRTSISQYLDLYEAVALEPLHEDGHSGMTACSTVCRLIDYQEEILHQIATLGGGNHFIELSEDNDDGSVWILVHSGSRHFGHSIASYYSKIAKEICKEDVPNGLHYLDIDTQIGQDYGFSVDTATQFAKHSREMMVAIICVTLADCLGINRVNIIPSDVHHAPHNTIELTQDNTIIHRKGAMKVSAGATGPIPGTMGTNSFIVKGLGNPDSYDTCSHGAGRAMSRSKAKSECTLAEMAADTFNVYSETIDLEHLDETPRAYKNINKIMNYQTDIVEVVHTLTPILNIKG